MPVYLKMFSVMLSLILVSSTSLHSQNSNQEAYILKYKDIAIRQMEQFGIPASIILAQGLLESGAGNSYLATKANNHFGIKCHDWKGATIRHDDDAKNECFRKYNSAEESFMDHSMFLRYRSRYSSLFNLDIKDYRGWAHGLKAAGYATNPDYAPLLIGIIEKYSLYLYDNPQATLPDSPDEVLALNLYIPENGSVLYHVSLQREILSTNGVPCIVATGMESYSSIAKEFSLFRKELLRFNDLSNEQPVESGTIIYLSRKKEQAMQETPLHIASGKETLRDISQKYAVRLKSLLKYNNIRQDHIIAEGTTIKLRNK